MLLNTLLNKLLHICFIAVMSALNGKMFKCVEIDCEKFGGVDINP